MDKNGDGESAVGELKYPALHETLKEGLEEVWVPCVGYEEVYEVSNFGKVRSKNPAARWKHVGQLRADINTLGYKRVCLSMNNIKRNHSVHTLVCNSFHINPNPTHLKTVEHHDSDPSNNQLNNLLFASQKYQNQRCNKKESQTSHAPKESRAVHMLDLTDDHVVMTHASMSDAKTWLRRHGGWPSASVSHISECAKGDANTAYGYKWRFVDVIVNLPGEVWKEVPREVLPSPKDGPYLASTEGRIQNKHGKLVHGCMSAKYLCVGNVRWNRIIAHTFCENDDPAQKTIVKHCNNIPIDNRAANLEWGTPRENTRDAVRDGLIDRTNVSQKVKAIHTVTGEERVFARVKDTAAEFGICTRTVWLRLNDGKVQKGTQYRFERVTTD